MKKIISIFLICSLLSISLRADVDPKPTVNPDVIALLNTQLPNNDKIQLKTYDWIWIGTFIIIGGVFGTITYTTRTPAR